MPEGLSPAEVGNEIGRHGKHEAEGGARDRRTRLLSITEAVLLSLVALLAAYSGYAAAKWSTLSSISLAKASAARTKASRADLKAAEDRFAVQLRERDDRLSNLEKRQESTMWKLAVMTGMGAGVGFMIRLLWH